MEEDEDYLTCGKCMTEFRLDRITSFIKHKKQDCREPDEQMKTGLQAELVCSSCPQGFMTAVGLLKHAQTIHKFQLFLEKTGIEEVRASAYNDTGQITMDNPILNKLHSGVHQSDSPLIYKAQLHKKFGESDIENSLSDMFDTEDQPNTSSFLQKSHLVENMEKPIKNQSNLEQTIKNQSTSVNLDKLSSSLSGSQNQNTNLSSSILNAIMKSGVIFPVVNKHLTDIPMSEELIKKKIDSQLTGKKVNQRKGPWLPLKTAGNKELFSEGELVKQQLTAKLVSKQCTPVIPVKTPNLPVDMSVSLYNSNNSLLKSDNIASTQLCTATTISTDVSNATADNGIGLHNNSFETETASRNHSNVFQEHSANEILLENLVQKATDSDSPDFAKIGCCNNQKCGVTVIPGTHEVLKKCCNAVVPKKRKRHFETKHTLSARQKLNRRISGYDLNRPFKNIDYGKRNSGTIFIDLEPNEDGTLSQKSDADNPSVSTGFNEIDFQVSGMCRDGFNSFQGKSKEKGSVILQPGAVFSIPIAYSLTTQPDGSLRPLVISKHTYQSQSSSTKVNTTPVNKREGQNKDNSSCLTNDRCTLKSHDNHASTSNSSSCNDDEKLGNEIDIDMNTQGDGGSHCRRRRYPTSRPFKCDKCESAFNQRIHLKKHMSKHTGVKPFKCQQCNYSTVERSHLKVHIRIHTGEKPFKCTYCEYATAQNSTLKIHLKRHHKPSDVPEPTATS